MEIQTTNKRDASYRQTCVVDRWIYGGRKSKAKAIREAGYSDAMARVPSKVFDSPAVQRLLELRGHGKKGISNNETPTIEVERVVELGKITGGWIKNIQ
jgi:hypothetical protein